MERKIEKQIESKKVAKTPQPMSNKAQVYQAWKAGETDPEKLLKKVDAAVKLQTIRGWMNRWKNGKGLPITP